MGMLSGVRKESDRERHIRLRSAEYMAVKELIAAISQLRPDWQMIQLEKDAEGKIRYRVLDEIKLNSR